MREKPLIYNIPAGLPFADSLAQGILERAGGDPFSLSEYLVLLPSRRACRTLRDAFLRLSGGNAVLLPRLQPIGDVDAEEVFLHLAADDESAEALNIPPAVSRLERQLLLARNIMTAGRAQSFDQAAALALELGKFLDEVQTERLDFADLKNLVPENFAEHWQMTLEFLKVLTEHWPGILQGRGVIDYAARRNLLLEAQARAWTKNPPQHPVIAAGSTGTVPAARELISLIARLPQGMLVLPGLDAALDDESWDILGEDHPQFNMKKLLRAAESSRAGVAEWPLKKKARVNEARVRLLSEALRPAETTERWRQLTVKDITPQSLDGLMRIDCDTPQEEADVIALVLREALETPEKTAALITPDRNLARRVSLSLRRWGIQIDDSGGQPLTETPVGAFLLLAAEMAEEECAPVALLSLLKHPFMAAGLSPEEQRERARLLDAVILRGPRPSPGIAGLQAAIEALDADKFSAAQKSLLAWLDKVRERMSRFADMMAPDASSPFPALLQEHLRMAEALASTGDEEGRQRLWAGEAGDAASSFLQDLRRAASGVPSLSSAQYVSLLRNLLKSVTVRPGYGSHPRLFILGQIEARLYCADLVVLGGLNEGTWPDIPAQDPWMSRPMRRAFGLPAPEKSLSLASHDFVQAASSPEVVITRARKVDGAPTVPARWLLRLEGVLSAVGLEMPAQKADVYRQWRKDMDMPAAIRPVSRPAPTPPVSARPRELSVTRIEAWMRDPYQIYAEKILDLKSFDPVDADPGAAERGTFIHKALELFVEAYPRELPGDAAEKLKDFGRRALSDLRVPQKVAAFWWPRFEKIAVEFVRQEREWRKTALPQATEVSGALDLGGFMLTGKADRIDVLPGGACAIIDYKSGGAPKKAEVQQGFSPQLPLEALMLREGKFEGVKAAVAEELVYWKVTGGGKTPVEQKTMASKEFPVPRLVAEAEAGLRNLIGQFSDEKTSYLSQPRAEAKPVFSDYDHLARVKEWGVSGDDGEEAA